MRFGIAVALLITPLGLALLAFRTPPQAQPQPPNIVLLMTDDMGYADIGSYGVTDIRTPNIDSLARGGIKMTDFYANAVVCTPTRAALMTGRYQHRYGLENALPATGDQGLPAAGQSLPQLLKNGGYATALIGKWHLGYRPEHSPISHGFDYFFGFKAGFIDYYHHTNGGGQADLWENDAPVQQTGYMTDLITARAVSFIEKSAGKPFFVDVAFNAPHWPYQVPDMPSQSRNNAAHLQPHTQDTSTRADYVAMVEAVDKSVGEILRTLDRLGLAGNTLVIFTNDNGGEWLSDNGPLFHRKTTVWEGGIRVPALLRWPGRIPAGRVSDQVGITMDLTASMLAAANAPVPDNVKLEGMNLLPILEGRSPEVERTLFWRTAGSTQRAVRSGDWKLVVDSGATFIFNLRTDAGERNDLTNQRQDIANRLRTLHTAWETDVNAEAQQRGVGGGARGARGAAGGARGQQ
jgi:arylsulfatase A-like enzyme